MKGRAIFLLAGAFFLVGALVGLGIRHGLRHQEGSNLDQLDALDAYEKIPAHLPRWVPKDKHSLPGVPQALASDGKGQIFAAVGKAVYLLAPDGMTRSRNIFPSEVTALAARGEALAVARAQHLSLFAAGFEGEKNMPSPGDGTRFISIALGEGRVLGLDFGHRAIWAYDLSGRLISRFDLQEGGQGPGLVLPSPQASLVTLPGGQWALGNTGRLRVEVHQADGALSRTWGGAGMALNQFPGCCNPVGLLVLPNGHFITWQKGLRRVLEHNDRGAVIAALMDPKEILPNVTHIAMAATATGEVLLTDGARASFTRYAPPDLGHRGKP